MDLDPYVNELFAFLWDVWIQYTIMKMKKPISEITVSLCFKQASIIWQIGLSEVWFSIRESSVSIAWDTWFWVHKHYCILRYDQDMVFAIFLHSWLWNYHILNSTGAQYLSKDVTGSHDHIHEKQHVGNWAWMVFSVIVALAILCALLVFVAYPVLETWKPSIPQMSQEDTNAIESDDKVKPEGRVEATVTQEGNKVIDDFVNEMAFWEGSEGNSLN